MFTYLYDIHTSEVKSFENTFDGTFVPSCQARGGGKLYDREGITAVRQKYSFTRYSTLRTSSCLVHRKCVHDIRVPQPSPTL